MKRPMPIQNFDFNPSVGYLAKAGTSTTCADCTNFDCETCMPDEPSKCVSCKRNPHFKSVMEVNGSGYCQENCPNTSYVTHTPYGNGCAPCDVTCRTCDGAGTFSCLSCDWSSPRPMFHRGQCLAACPAGYASNGSSYCLPCDPSCGSCSTPDSAMSCTSCAGKVMPRRSSATRWNFAKGIIIASHNRVVRRFVDRSPCPFRFLAPYMHCCHHVKFKFNHPGFHVCGR